MGYRDDAFWELPQSEQASVNFNNNGTFKYPSKNIRFLAAQEQLHPIPGVKSNDYKLTRGYIRGLTQRGVHNDTFKPLRCNFQFNPQQIIQSVAMREDVYLPILQDPTQFSQPFAGSVNFNFDLLFDRSMEVSQGTLQGSTTTNLFDENYWESQDIGVMADLQVLYAVIGQGFSKSTMDFQRSRLEDAVNREVTSTANDLNESPELSRDQVATSTSSFVAEDNLGNAAFLIPNPVRVIFSSLFMVDGFVTGTNVDFLKFSTNMVPLQARVSISMNAIYVGFAKEKTFLTEQLESSYENSQREEASRKQEVFDLLKTTKKLVFFSGTMSSDLPTHQWVVTDQAAAGRGWTKSGFYSMDVALDVSGDPITDLPISKFKQLNADISGSFYLNIYGPYTNESQANTVADNTTQAASTAFIGSYFTTVKSFVNQTGVFLNPNFNKGIQEVVYLSANALFSNKASYAFSEPLNSNLSNYYYVVDLYAALECSVGLPGVTPIVSKTNKRVVIQGSDPILVTVPLYWTM